MKSLDLNSYIVIDEYSSTPKYKQLVNSIYLAIEKGILQKNSPLPGEYPKSGHPIDFKGF